MKPLCEICGDHHETWQAHVFKKSGERKEVFKEVQKVVLEAAKRPAVVHDRGDGAKPKEPYNVYMKGYMRVWRAIRSGRASWWPRRV